MTYLFRVYKMNPFHDEHGQFTSKEKDKEGSAEGAKGGRPSKEQITAIKTAAIEFVKSDSTKESKSGDFKVVSHLGVEGRGTGEFAPLVHALDAAGMKEVKMKSGKGRKWESEDGSVYVHVKQRSGFAKGTYQVDVAQKAE